MESRRLMLNNKLGNKESVVDHVMGYYLSRGNISPNHEIPIFKSLGNRVMIDYLGTMMWINVHPADVFIDAEDRVYAQNKQRKLETIKCNKSN